MRKALVTVHLGRHFRIFGQYDYQVLKSMGYEVHIASNFNDIIDNFDDKDVIKHQISFDRNPFSLSNYKAYYELRDIISKNEFDIIQTQSPSAGVVTRLAALKTRRKNKTRLFYTPHGFHFYKGASKKRWLVFYPIEKIMSKFTDTIITINNEDYELAKRKKMGRKVELIPGVGIDTNKYYKVSENKKLEMKRQLGFSEDKIIITYIGELSHRKNQKFLIDSLSKFEKKNKIQLVLVGSGHLEKDLKLLVNEKKLQDCIVFLGYRNDVDDILKATDIVVSSSLQEGLPVNIMESISSGLPIIVSNCRGNRDLIHDGDNGFTFNINNTEEFLNKLDLLVESKNLREVFGERNMELSLNYSIDSISTQMKRIYSSS